MGPYQRPPAPSTAVHDHHRDAVAGLVMNSTLVGSTLSSALSLNVTVVNSSSSSTTSGAQLTNYSLTTAAVDNTSLVLSGDPSTGCLRGMTCHHFYTAKVITDYLFLLPF